MPPTSVLTMSSRPAAPRTSFAFASTTSGITTPVAGTHRGDAALIDRFADAWQTLSRETPNDWAFYTPAWLRAWYGAFGNGRPLVIVTVFQADRLLAIAPFIEERRGPLRLWRAPANVYAGKADILVHPHHRDRALALLWQEIERHPWHAIDWPLAPEGGAMTALAAHRAAAGQPVITRQSHRTPLVALDHGTDLDRLGPHKHLRRFRRQLGKIGTLEERATIPATPDQLETFFRLEAASWKGALGTDAGNDPACAAFHRALVDLPKNGDFVTTAHEILLDGQTIAIEIGFRSGDRHFAHKGTYDEAWRKYSPGQLSASFLLRDAHAAGCATFDFLGCDEPYKMLWTSTTEAIHHLIFFRANPLGHLARASMVRGIPVVKRLRAARQDLLTFARHLPGAISGRLRVQPRASAPSPSSTDSGKEPPCGPDAAA